MKNEPLISVIVPIYNIERYIGVCIESLLHQTYNNLEIILVDDGSPDRCPEICDLYASKDSRINVVHKTNGGLVSARKAGIMVASGDYIGYVDGDDWVGPGFYKSLYNSIYETDADIAIAGFCRDLFSRTNIILNSIHSGLYDGYSFDCIKKRMISDGLFYRHGITTYLWNKLFKKKNILTHQLSIPNNITIGEDAAVVYPAILESTKIVITDNCAYHYRQREDSMLQSSENFSKEATLLKSLNDYMHSIVLKNNNAYNLQHQVDDFIVGTYIIRSGGCIPNSDNKLFPFGKDISCKKVVIFGAGTFGQQFVKRNKSTNRCDIIAWIDDDYWEYRRCCLDVDPIETICNLVYDYVVIANLNPSVISDTTKRLFDYGVPKNKILSISTAEEERSLALKAYLNI